MCEGRFSNTWSIGCAGLRVWLRSLAFVPNRGAVVAQFGFTGFYRVGGHGRGVMKQGRWTLSSVRVYVVSN